MATKVNHDLFLRVKALAYVRKVWEKEEGRNAVDDTNNPGEHASISPNIIETYTERSINERNGYFT